MSRKGVLSHTQPQKCRTTTYNPILKPPAYLVEQKKVFDTNEQDWKCPRGPEKLRKREVNVVGVTRCEKGEVFYEIECKEANVVIENLKRWLWSCVA